MIYKAIETKYLPATNTKGARIKAIAEGNNSITISYDYGLNPATNHHLAANALCEKLNWVGHYIQGETKNGYVFVRE